MRKHGPTVGIRNAQSCLVIEFHADITTTSGPKWSYTFAFSPFFLFAWVASIPPEWDSDRPVRYANCFKGFGRFQRRFRNVSFLVAIPHTKLEAVFAFKNLFAMQFFCTVKVTSASGSIFPQGCVNDGDLSRCAQRPIPSGGYLTLPTKTSR